MKRILGFLLPALAITALILVIVLAKRDKVYELPDLSSIDREEIDEISIQKIGLDLTIKREGDEWKIQPEKYRTDPAKIRKMLEGIAELTVTDMVSVKKAYDRYDLDEESRIRVQAFIGGKLVRQADIGKISGSSRRHTFVMLPDDERIYQASGSFRSDFDIDKEDLRDKLVLSFERESIQEILLETPESSFKLTKASETKSSEEKETTVRWLTEAGEEWMIGRVDDLLGHLSSLRCERYGDENADMSRPDLSVILKGEKEYLFTLFGQEGEEYLAGSSESAYPFRLSSGKAEQVLGIWDGNPNAEGE